MQILGIPSTHVNIQMKASEQYFHVTLFSVLYKMILTSKSVGQTVKCDHSNESYWAVLSCGTVCAIRHGSNLERLYKKPSIW